MPWREVDVVDVRMELVHEIRKHGAPVTEAATHWGVSRKTAYKWVQRYESEGPTGLHDRSRRPHGHPDTTTPEVEQAVLAAHRRFPKWSPSKVRDWLGREQPELGVPSRSTTYAILRRHGRTAPPRPRRSASPRPVHAALTVPREANEVWTTDFKGHFALGDRTRCHPLTLRDGWSRYVLCCRGLQGEAIAPTQRAFERAFWTYGLPRRMRMDNGRPFTGPGIAGLTTLSVWWLRLGIVLERIMPGHPEQNGSHEQFHGVLKRHTARPPAPTMRAQQRRFDAFCHEYNHERPHDALSGASPVTRFAPSPRSMPTQLPVLEYPGHVEVRRVASNGAISWRNQPLFVSEALRGEWIGLEEVDEDVWTVWLGAVRLARFDGRHQQWS